MIRSSNIANQVNPVQSLESQSSSGLSHIVGYVLLTSDWNSPDSWFGAPYYSVAGNWSFYPSGSLNLSYLSISNGSSDKDETIPL